MKTDYSDQKEEEDQKELRGLTSTEDSINASIQRLEDYIKKAWMKTDYSDQQQYRQHKHQQKKNN